MSRWNIYHKDGTKLTDVNDDEVVVHGLQYSDKWMGDCFLTIDFKNNAPINFKIGDYIIYRGERFELNYEPGKDKKASLNTYGEGFVYESVKFNALQDELSRSEFLDVVLNDNELHYTALPKFSFYVQTLDDLLDRIQANLDEQIGKGVWKVYSRSKERSLQRGCSDADWKNVYGEGTSNNVIESKSITVDGKTCWEALALVNSEWDVNFIVRGRNVYVGTAGVLANNIFKYGLGKGLSELIQNADSEQQIVTRLRAYGSEKNLPSHYYADLGVKYFCNITEVNTATSYLSVYIDMEYIDNYFTIPRVFVPNDGTGKEQTYGYVLKVTFDFQTVITCVVTALSSGKAVMLYSEVKNNMEDNGDEPSKENLDRFIAQVNAGNRKLYITGGLNTKAVPSSMKEYAQNLPNNMSINWLMLPGFPHVSLNDYYNSLSKADKEYVNPTGKEHIFSTNPHRPYIDSVNIQQIGLRSASQYFDNDDKTNGIVEIYPTIEEMVIGGVRVDEIDEGVAPDDNGRFEDGQTVNNVDIYLNPSIDFDINDLKDSDFSIAMKDGMCGGRTFKVASSVKENGRWRLTIQRVKDDALELWFPYKDYPIRKGDHFVLTGITLPDSYVNAASLKLLKYAIAYIDKNDYTRYVYQPKVDEVFMARQNDQATEDKTGTIKSLHDTLKAGDIMEFDDDDLHIGGKVTIDQLVIRENEGGIPTYEVTLRNDVEVGTMAKIKQQISSLEAGNGKVSSETSKQITDSAINEASKHFLSKLKDDTAQGVITFLKGIAFGAEELWRITKDGIATLFSLSVKGNTQLGDNGTSTTFGDYKTDTSGAVVRVDDKGVSYMEADYITIRRAADFREITIRELRYIGGELAITPAAMQVSKVERLDASGSVIPQDDTSTEVAAYKCYFETEGTDGQKKLYQEFMPYDQARCQQWGIDAGTSEHVRTKYYWRLVTAVGTDYIILSNKTYDTSTENSEPAVGDNIVQLGYQGESRPNRQSAIILSATSTDAPSQKYYQGIHDFTLTDCVVKDEGYDAAKGTFHTNTYGDSYVGDKEGNGYMKYDSNTKTMTIKGTVHFDSDSTKDGEEIASKADLRDLNIKSGNLLRNTAFCGDYEDIEVSDDLEMTDDSEVYSDKLKYWTLSKAKVVDDADTTSGKAVLLSDGSITQQLTAPLLANSEYTLSFRGKGTTAYIEVCGVVLTQTMDTESRRYELHFSTPTGVASFLFKIKGTSCTISEIMLSYGTLAPAWSPAYSDNDKSLAEFKNLKFLTDAIAEGSTTIDGGLVMSQQFRVGNYRNKKMIKETGGMSGYYNDDNSPFLWGGGSLVQAIYTIQKYKNDPTYQPTEEEISNMAKFVVTHGGRAILNDIILRGIIYAEGGVMKSVKSPNGNFEIDEQGNLKANEAVVENVKSTGGYFQNVSVSGNIYTPYTVINDSNKMKYGEYGLDWIALYFRLNLEASGFNVQVELKEEKRDVLIELPEDEKYLGAEINILCTYGYLGVKNASYLSSYNINSDIQFEIKYPILFQGQTMNLKCIKVADQIRWIVLQNTDLMYSRSVQPKLIALVQTKYDASKNVYEFFNYSRGYGFWYADSFARILYVSTGVHVVKYDNIQPPDMVIEPNVVNGFINYTVDSDKKEIKFTVYDYNHKLSDNVKFGFKIYNISRIGNYIPSADGQSINN